MDAPTELMERAKELVRSLCARNLIPGADLTKVTLAVHDELCGSSLAILAEVGLRTNFSCRGNLEVAIKATGFELVRHLIKREKVKDGEEENDPVIRTRPLVAPKTECPIGLRSCPLHVTLVREEAVLMASGT